MIFIALPLWLGHATGSYVAAALPGAVLVLAVIDYAADPTAGPDEVDVLPSLWVVGSAIAVISCVAGAAVARRRRRRQQG